MAKMREACKIGDGDVTITVFSGGTDEYPNLPPSIEAWTESMSFWIVVRNPEQLERLAELLNDAAIIRREQLRAAKK